MTTTPSPAQVGIWVSDAALRFCNIVQNAPLWVWPAILILVALWIIYNGTRRIRMS
ncbi:MAG TPA: hypothetical protein VFJ58_13480 [Armatimonadota bacterium]|nr:hypothetical protein [Armatimonadota bacterium]